MIGRRIVIIGAGYVGMPTALLMARAGHDVLAVDIDSRVVDAIAHGRAPQEAPALQPILDEPALRSRLRASMKPEAADVFLIAVPTPVADDGKSADLAMVRAACEGIVPFLARGNLVVIESTVPPRTCEDLIRSILEKSGLKVPGDLRLAHAPERVFPGDTIRELVENERIIGGIDDASTRSAVELYRTFVRGRIHETTARTAEFTKLLENTYRDVNIALANEIARLAAGFQIDPFAAIELANCHPRVNILSPGIGVGGHCIPVDPWFLLAHRPADSRLIPAARAINNEIPARMANAILELTRAALTARSLSSDHPRLLLLGASYKPEIADLRDAPALEIARRLHAAGCDVTHLDPHAPGFDHPLIDAASLPTIAKDHDACIVLVPHSRILAALSSATPALIATLRAGLILNAKDLVRHA